MTSNNTETPREFSFETWFLMSKISGATCNKTTALLLHLLYPFKQSKACGRASNKVKLFLAPDGQKYVNLFRTDTLPQSCAGSLSKPSAQYAEYLLSPKISWNLSLTHVIFIVKINGSYFGKQNSLLMCKFNNVLSRVCSLSLIHVRCHKIQH